MGALYGWTQPQLAWGFDHCGVSGEISTAELYLRTAAMAMLCPIMQYHAGLDRGRPLMRPLALHWPRDARVWDFPYQYMLGDHLLVAPVTEPGVDELDVHLPEGRWVDVWTAAEHEGARVIRAAAPLDRIPAFARGDRAAHLVEVFTGAVAPRAPGRSRRHG